MPLTLFARPRKAADTPPPRGASAGGVFAHLDKPENLPHLSDTTVRAMALANDPDATLADMAALIRRDGVLAAGLLKLANSVVYRGSSEVTDVQQAVMRVGLRGCGNMLAAAGVKKLYAGMPPAVQGACEKVLRHSLFVGGLAARVARSLRLPLGGEEYTAGLLHDIGRVVMCVHAPDRYPALCTSGSDTDPDVRAGERELFGTDHCGLGRLFAVKNALPDRIGRAIQHHHHPEAEGEFRPLAAVVGFADAVANHLHRRQVVSERVEAFRQELKALVVQCVRETRGLVKSLAG